jgi:hypothetical protein
MTDVEVVMVVLDDLNLSLRRYRDEKSKLMHKMKFTSLEQRQKKALDCLNYTYYSANVNASGFANSSGSVANAYFFHTTAN